MNDFGIMILGYYIQFFSSVMLIELQCPISNSPCNFQRLCINNSITQIVSTRFSSFSRRAHALYGMNPNPHAGIPICPTRIRRLNIPTKVV
jgi:hypothetical protein